MGEASAIVISTILFVSTLYWAIRGPMNPKVSAFFFFMLTHFLYSLTACVVTLSLASPLPTIELCIGAVAVFALLNVAVMGFLAPVPPWWGGMGLISYMRWAFGAFMINQYTNLDMDNIGGLLCTGLNVLEIFKDNNPSQLITGSPPPSSPSGNFQGICPNSPALNATINTFSQPGPLTANCAPIVVMMMSGELDGMIQYDSGTFASNFLGGYPKGDGYDAKRKFTEFSRWECLGYLLILFFAFLGLYWQTCKLSIKLVKR